MIKNVLKSVLAPRLLFKNRATFYNGQFDAAKDYYLILGVSKNADDA